MVSRLLLCLAGLPSAWASGTGQLSWVRAATSGQHSTALASNADFAIRLKDASGAEVAGWAAGGTHTVELYLKAGSALPGFTGYIMAPFSGALASEPSACTSTANLLCTTATAASCAAQRLTAANAASQQQMGSACKLGVTHKSSTSTPATATSAGASWVAPASGFGAVTV